ncbi:hypothetical protein Pfo_007985 [Paulownia fortunei]|nr:hypothetical protein Pfo_007985 [Paulownia fortunei]
MVILRNVQYGTIILFVRALIAYFDISRNLFLMNMHFLFAKTPCNIVTSVILIKDHVVVQVTEIYMHYTEAAVLQDIPIFIQAKISQTLCKFYVENVPLLNGCSSEFINQIVIRVHEEYNICLEYLLLLFFVCELCRLLRIDKQTFSNILEIYFQDRRNFLTNLLEVIRLSTVLDTIFSYNPFGYNIQLIIVLKLDTVHLRFAKYFTNTLRVNSAAYYGDLYQLKSLIRAGADPSYIDYDRRSPLCGRFFHSILLHQEDITLFLIQECVDVNAEDKFGSTPLLEAIKGGHDRVASLLSREGASLKIDNAGDSDLLRGVLSNGIDPNSKDYDHRTALHVAASQGLYLMAKLLLEAGASVFSKDRDHTQGIALCFHFTLDHKECRRHGLVMWVPHSIEELINVASKQLGLPDRSCILSAGGKILEVDMIADGQKLYMINETN